MEQALQKRWAGKTRIRGIPLCVCAAWIYGALLWDECPAGGEPVGQEQRGWEGRHCDGLLLEAPWLW